MATVEERDFVLVPHRIAGKCQARQQACAPLGHFFAAGIERGASCGKGRIVVLCFAVDLHQVCGK